MRQKSTQSTFIDTNLQLTFFNDNTDFTCTKEVSFVTSFSSQFFILPVFPFCLHKKTLQKTPWLILLLYGDGCLRTVPDTTQLCSPQMVLFLFETTFCRTSKFNADGLRFSVKLVRIFGAFSSDPRGFGPSKWHVKVPDHPAIAPHRAHLWKEHRKLLRTTQEQAFKQKKKYVWTGATQAQA